ncbi:MAG TPA: cytochrome c peroxidase [Methylomirabilota bacterium]|nr:cytochrome c peroxidase [Methylomirabilota bacterium]
MSGRRIGPVGALVLALVVLWAAAAAVDPDQRALDRLRRPPLGLPPVPDPGGEAPTEATIRLGRALFLDRRLSVNNTLSCAMCHVPEQGFAVNEIRTAVGHEGASLRRNAPTLLNVAYAAPFFLDGREPDLSLQPLDVLVNPDEMAMPSLGAVVERVRSITGYDRMFADAFGGPATAQRIGGAIAAYLRTLLAADSPFDRWYYGGDEDAVSAAARRGFGLFTGRAGCSACHRFGESDGLFRDGAFHDTGLGRRRGDSTSRGGSPVEVELVPGMVVTMAADAVASVGETPLPDLGRAEVTGDPSDRWRYKTPSLRNVALTAPYMHNGSIATLREVVEFYRDGGFSHDGIDPLIRPIDLDDGEVDDLVAFLESLTAGNLDELVADARSVPVGNPGME